MATQQRCVGTVVHMANFGDAHRVVELVSREQGRLAVVARGARASKRRFGGIVDLFSTLQVELSYSRSAQLPTLVSADARALRLGLRRDLGAMGRAGFFCACARALLPPLQAAPIWVGLFEQALDSLNAGEVAHSARFFAPMLRHAGLLPPCRCASCGRVPPAAALGLRLSDGALCCTLCAPKLGALSHSVLQALSEAPAPPLNEHTARELERLVALLVSLQQGKPLRPPNYLG